MEPVQNAPAQNPLAPNSFPTEENHYMTEPPADLSVTSTPSEPIKSTSKSSSKLVYAILIIILLILIAVAGYLIMMRKSAAPANTKQNPGTVTTPTFPPTSPTTAPVSSGNVDQTLSTTDTSMQESINQANTDLIQVNSINTTQDNAN